jgi:small subunit ribosomal protein S9
MAETTQETVAVAPDKASAQKAAPAAQSVEAKQKKRAVRKKAARKPEKVIAVKSKRKNAVARAYLKEGTGRISVNGFDVNVIEPVALRHTMLEPIAVSAATAGLAKGLDIKVDVDGGGQSAQAQAVRGAIAKGIALFAGTDTVKKEYMRYDRSMLVDDPRRVEPKKFKGPKARARFQKSYR